MRPVDIFVLLGVLRARDDGGWTIRSLAANLKLPVAAVQRSLSRLGRTPAYDGESRRVSLSAVEELLHHALPYVVLGRLGELTRGTPTAWAATPLRDQLASVDDLPPVWPSFDGEVRGLAVQPLHPAALALAREDSDMAELLALVDALRLGDARVRGLARVAIDERLGLS